MKTSTYLFAVFLLFIIGVECGAQSPRRRGVRRPADVKPAASQPTPEPAPATTPAPPAPARAPVPLAILNGQTITTADINNNARQEIEALDQRIAVARQQVLEIQINTVLLETEAAKRRITPQQLYELEIVRKVGEPTAAEIEKVIQENRAQIDPAADPAAVRAQVVSYLKGEREATITDELIKRLRGLYPVVAVAPANAQTLPPTAVVVTVGGRPITAGPIEERLKPIIYKLRLNAYQLTRQELDVTLNDMLLLAEANKLNVGPEEIVRKEITDKVRAPTVDEIAKFYADNKARIPTDLSTASNQIASYLQEQNRQHLEQEFSNRLRTGANIRILITEPALPVQSISVDDDPVRGDASAPVTIVEFTDFQCPSCAAMQPILEDALKTYGNKVRLVVRDFPLNMHANARKAAEAANAARAQGKFFEYTALLFKRQNALDVPSLKKYATELGLDRARFDADLDSGKFFNEVKHDIDDGEMYGVDSTPAIFVNGVALREMSSEALKALIDRGLTGGSKISSN